MDKLNQNERAFLIGLEKLTRETGIKIYGCGCCGSPFLLEANITDIRSGYGMSDGQVEWLDPSDDFSWGRYSHTIVKE